PPGIFTTPNLGAELIASAFTFGGYSESLPFVGFTGDYFVSADGDYVRKHNPWVNWQLSSENGIPEAANMPFTDFPSDFSLLPTVSFVVPNQQHDMHDGTIAEADAWLMANLDSYVQWAMLHNSLLILTWDEDDYLGTNQIPTIFAGANVITSEYGELINHFNVLRTIEDVYGLGHAGNSATATPITDVFVVPEPGQWGLLAAGLAVMAACFRRKCVKARWLGQRGRSPVRRTGCFASSRSSCRRGC
ncbi:MAG: alkaline phosphatase family protein, partial [Chthoniobacterales bacterium]